MKTKELIRQCALKYERYKDQLPQINPEDVEQFRKEVEQVYDRITGQRRAVNEHLKVLVVTGNPYETLEEMTEGINSSGQLRVSMDFNNSNLLPEGLNLKFRAIHDYFHYLLQEPFTFKGELNVYKAQKFIHKSEIGRRILYSEIVLQAAYATYFGCFPSKQKVII